MTSRGDHCRKCGSAYSTRPYGGRYCNPCARRHSRSPERAAHLLRLAVLRRAPRVEARRRARERLLAVAHTIDDPRIEPCPTTGCWLWMGARSGGGYGTTHQNRKAFNVHRVAWEKANGPIPVGMYLDHICRQRLCCNPDHLRVVTPRQNALENSVGVAAKNAAKLSCPRCGSAFVANGTKGRRCLPCATRSVREARRRKGAVPRNLTQRTPEPTP